MSCNRNINLGPPEYQAGALITAQLCLVRDGRKSEENEREVWKVCHSDSD
jgi:hypothetical protein